MHGVHAKTYYHLLLSSLRIESIANFFFKETSAQRSKSNSNRSGCEATHDHKDLHVKECIVLQTHISSPCLDLAILILFLGSCNTGMPKAFTSTQPKSPPGLQKLVPFKSLQHCINCIPVNTCILKECMHDYISIRIISFFYYLAVLWSKTASYTRSQIRV